LQIGCNVKLIRPEGVEPSVELQLPVFSYPDPDKLTMVPRGPLSGVTVNVAVTTKSTMAESSSEPTTRIEWTPPLAFDITVNEQAPMLPADAVQVKLLNEIQRGPPTVDVRFIVT
jgi:hypothetical protein